MSLRFRPARESDIPAVLALLEDDALGKGREGADMAVYTEAFHRMAQEGANTLFVGEDESGRIVATYQLTMITGLSLRATRRAQVESVRVASGLRGHGLGRALMADAEARARAGGCAMMQLTSNAARDGAHRFYGALGYASSHTGFKKAL